MFCQGVEGIGIDHHWSRVIEHQFNELSRDIVAEAGANGDNVRVELIDRFASAPGADHDLSRGLGGDDFVSILRNESRDQSRADVRGA